MADNGFAEGYAVGQGTMNNGMNGWGGAWGDWFWIIILFALWGNNGWGFGGNGGGSLTRSDLCQDMNFNNLESAVRGIQNGLCDGFYAQNTNLLNGFAGVQQTLCQGFGGVTNAITNQGYESRLATQGLSAQLASCCCDIERGIDRLSCQSATDTAAIIQAGSNNTQRILDYLCNQDLERKNEKIASLQLENQNLKFATSQATQTQNIVNQLRMPTPVPAYLTCSPYQSAFGFPYAQSGCNNGCGCNGTFGYAA